MNPEIITKKRIQSIDLLRGLVIVLMALDHTRDFFHADAMIYDPTDLSKTNALLFSTRWITHFCAPVFSFLAGTSAYLMGLRKTKKQLSIFLLTRGLWLVLLELTVVNFSWSFNLALPFFALVNIWALGIGMMSLSALILLPLLFILLTGVAIIAVHNLLDNIHIPGQGLTAFLWSALHDVRVVPENFYFLDRPVEVVYPVLSWIGVITLGYCFGYFYQPGILPEQRKKVFSYFLVIAVALFILLRALNIYGDPAPWSLQASSIFTLMSFMNVTKYPPSLLYLLITLGPAMFILIVAENRNNLISKAIIRIGRVPMFFYVLHLYLIHFFAMIAAKLTGFEWSDMVSQVPFTPIPQGYGFSLLVVYLVWILIVLLLYPFCKRYDRYKSNHKEKWWLSYL
ncbi:MAG: DUF1624 domain-containing protein [Ginsengibacter sp.]